MATLESIISQLDQTLEIARIPDYPGAINGLQLAGKLEVGKVGAAVDASLPVVRDAVAAGVDLLVVHHGMFWSGAQPIVGGLYEKLKLAIDAGMAIYSCHIPLDVHPQLGNNAILAGSIGLADTEPFFDWKGIKLGLKGAPGGSLLDLAAKVEVALGSKVHLCPGGGSDAGLVGVITGGAGGEINAIAAEGIDTFITGEGPHWSYTAAQELGVNIIYGGHYATETFGVRALAAQLAGSFGVDEVFLDHPTGL
jgi:dinuclear metal center YbgI/SA1388 family protein